MRNSRTARPKRDDRGVVAIELVLVAPFLFVLLMAIADSGMYFSKKVETESYARDAARAFALGGPTAVVSVPTGWTLVAPAPTPCPAGDTSRDVVVTLSRTYVFSLTDTASLGLINLGTKTITAIGKMRCGG